MFSLSQKLRIFTSKITLKFPVVNKLNNNTNMKPNLLKNTCVLACKLNNMA